MDPITDDYMREMLATTKPYTMVLLRKTPKRQQPGAAEVIWEHGRRNFELRRDGILRIVCPISGKTDLAGMCIFSTEVERTKRIMDGDPAVKAGVLTYEVYSAVSFPHDSLG